MTELSSTPKATLITGGVGCGKTTLLVEKAASLLANGTSPETMLLIAATPDAAQCLREQLINRCSALLVPTQRIDICIPSEISSQLLATDEGRAFSGRTGRVATPIELDFIMKDMAVSGLKSTRLQAMLEFFYRNWTELAGGISDDDSWLISGEEADTHRLLKEILNSFDCILKPELSAMAVRLLAAKPSLCATAQKSHVLVDDYQMLCRASQYLANALACESITIATDPMATIQASDPYPYPQGIEEFKRANPSFRTVQLTKSYVCAASHYAIAKLRSEAGFSGLSLESEAHDAPSPTLATMETSNPDSEAAAVAQAVEAAISRGTPPSSIYILTFHPAWEQAIANALDARGIESVQPKRPRIRTRNFADHGATASAKIVTALALAADPQNAMAWRCWCGFDDHLARSSSFAVLRSYAKERNLTIEDTLNLLCAQEPSDPYGEEMTAVAKAYRTGRHIIEMTASLRGNALLEALAANLGVERSAADAAYKDISSLICGTTGEVPNSPAAELYRLVASRLDRPSLDQCEHRVLIGSELHLIGRSPDILMLTGFVNGLFPTRDHFDATALPPAQQKKALESDKRRLYAFIGKARCAVTASWFTSANIPDAETLKLNIERINLRRGKRLATIKPSVYLELISPDNLLIC